MAENLGSTQRGLGNRCTPMLTMGDSREAAITSSDCTPQLELITTSNVEPPVSEVTDNTSDTGNAELSESSVNIRPKKSKVRLYTGKKTPNKRKEGTRRKWTKEEYEVAVKCKLRVEAEGIDRGVGSKVHEYWEEKNMFDIEEKILMNQIRTIIKKGWLTKVEIETIKRRVESQLANQDENVDVDDLEVRDERSETNSHERVTTADEQNQDGTDQTQIDRPASIINRQIEGERPDIDGDEEEALEEDNIQGGHQEFQDCG